MRVPVAKGSIKERMELQVRNWLWFLGVAATVLVGAPAARADMICRSPGGIAGFSNEFAMGKRLVGRNTSEVDQLRIYLTTRDEKLYAHSNFVTDILIEDHDGHVERNTVPTKLLVESQVIDFPAVVKNVLGDESFTIGDFRKLAPNIVVYVDDAVSATRWRVLDYERAQVNLVTHDGLVLRTREFRFPGGDSERLINVGEFYARRSNYSEVRTSLAMLVSAELPVRVKILPLTTNVATWRELRANASSALVDEPLRSLEGIERELRRDPGAVVVVLGHFENGAFVLRDAAGRQVLSASLDALFATALEAGVGLIPLGCYTAARGRGGSATRFNTLNAAKRLGNAVKAKTYIDMFSSIGGDDLAFVFDPQMTVSMRTKVKQSVVFDGYATGSGSIARLAFIMGASAVPKAVMDSQIESEPVVAAPAPLPVRAGDSPTESKAETNSGCRADSGELWGMSGAAAIIGAATIARRRRKRAQQEDRW